jgi:hypothetical protein
VEVEEELETFDLNINEANGFEISCAQPVTRQVHDLKHAVAIWRSVALTKPVASLH